MLRSVIFVFAAIMVTPCFAQDAEIKVMVVNIDYERGSPTFLQWFAKMRTSEQGIAITKAVCAYFGVPPKVVDVSTEQIWKPQLVNIEAGEEGRGRVDPPSGYEICAARRLGETSITGDATLNVSVKRDSEHGFHWYAHVPQPVGPGAGNQYARATWELSFVRNDVWEKYKAKCVPANYVRPGRYVLEACKGQNCRGPYKF